MLAAFAACSDDDDPVVDPVDDGPIKSLVIPEGEQLTGDAIMLTGGGFAQGCKIQLRQDGSETALETTVTEITDVDLVFTAPADAVGKYTLVLVQGGNSYDLGEITFKLPIDNLVMPEGDQEAGADITLTGSGFDEKSVIYLLAEGSDVQVDVSIVEVTNAKLVFATTKKTVGKHSVMLRQDGKVCKLGELNFVKPVISGNIYGVIPSEGKYDICQIGVAGESIGDILFTVESDLILEGIVADKAGKIYYRFVDDDRAPVELRYYDTKAKTGGKIEWANVDKCVAIGVDENNTLIALRVEPETDIVEWVTLDVQGEELDVVQNMNGAFTDPFMGGSLYNEMYTNDGMFLMDHSAIIFGLEIVDEYGYSYQNTCLTSNGEMSVGQAGQDYGEIYYCAAIKIADDKFYAFQTGGSEDDGYTTDVNVAEKAENVLSSFSKKSTFDGDFRGGIVYDKDNNLIYGFTDERNAILSFNVETNQPVARWSDSGIYALFTIPEGE